jgi:hypothetical protein
MKGCKEPSIYEASSFSINPHKLAKSQNNLLEGDFKADKLHIISDGTTNNNGVPPLPVSCPTRLP